MDAKNRDIRPTGRHAWPIDTEDPPMPASFPLAMPPSLETLRSHRRPLVDVNAIHRSRIGRLDRLALFITQHVGTIGFFLIILAWTTCWLGWNLIAPKSLRFDPPMAFVLWLFISNMIQILLMPLIMVGQNLQGRHSELRAEHDLHVNIKAEREIEVVLAHLENQNTILLAMVQKLGIDLAQISGEAKDEKAP
jgi:uncharacterized membrane protein